MRKPFSMYEFPGMFFDADGGGAGAGGDGGQQPAKPEPKFTQEDVDRLVGEARKAGRDTGVSKLLEGLGVKDADELKASFEEGKKLKDSQKTELEKLTERINAAESKAASLQADADNKLAAMRKRIQDSEIKTLAARAITDKDGKVTRHGFRPEALDDVLLLIDRTGIEEKDDKFTGIDKALETLAKAKPYLLADANSGRQPNGTPKPGERKPNAEPSSNNKPGQSIIRSL